MKKKLGIWITLILIGIVLLGMLFFTVDSYRIKQNRPPIFAIQAQVLKDGGTVIYYGLGYKIIDYHTIEGKNEIQIGSYFMKYENKIVNATPDISNTPIQYQKYVPLTQLPQEYSFEQALKDKCFIISYKNIYNKKILDEFIENTGMNSKNRIPDTIRIVQYTVEGDMILTDIEYTKDGNYKITTDNTRDKFSSKEDRVITKKEDFPGKIYGIVQTEEENYIKIELALYAIIDYIDETSKQYKNETIAIYSKTATIYELGPTILATVLQVEENLFFVEPDETQNLRK